MKAPERHPECSRLPAGASSPFTLVHATGSGTAAAVRQSQPLVPSALLRSSGGIAAFALFTCSAAVSGRVSATFV